MTWNEGLFDNVKLMLNNQFQDLDFVKKSTHENWARGNRKTLKWLKMVSKIKFRNLKLKSCEEYLSHRTSLVLIKT